MIDISPCAATKAVQERDDEVIVMAKLGLMRLHGSSQRIEATAELALVDMVRA